MNTLLPAILVTLVCCAVPALATDNPESPTTRESGPAEAEARKIKGWGKVTDPAGTCKLEGQEEGAKLAITLPAGAEKAHNLCIELDSMDAPRVQREMSGDFELQVKVEAAFEPGEEVLPGSRVPYLGAGLNIMADERNYIRLERASMRFDTPEPRQYINFEIRVDGQLQKFGSNEKWPLDPEQPVWLRLERAGGAVRGAISHDGKDWHWGEAKKLTGTAWEVDKVKAGVHAISSCPAEFAPVFSEFLLEDVEPEAPSAEKEPAKD